MNNMQNSVTDYPGDIYDLVLAMSGKVKRAVADAVQSVLKKDAVLASRVIEDDKAINSYEIDIDTATYKHFSLSSPQPQVVRWLLAVQKINANLERIGDHAVNIAESAITLAHEKESTPLFELPHMCELAETLLYDAIQSFLHETMALAHDVLTRDEAIDLLNSGTIATAKEKVMKGEESFDLATDIIRISKNLERIADLSTNIAEEAIFSMENRIVKHHAAKMEVEETR